MGSRAGTGIGSENVLISPLNHKLSCFLKKCLMQRFLNKNTKKFLYVKTQHKTGSGKCGWGISFGGQDVLFLNTPAASPHMETLAKGQRRFHDGI